ncbi:MAG: guanylate kinase [Holosporales bacterium]|jgi:guanylate kinase|nr:guanylate kinase [Holosporales bacterium]
MLSTKENHNLFILSAPSCGGKTTVAKILVAHDDKIKRSVSFCTRNPRVSEVNGQDYFFIDRGRFLSMKNGGEFLEYAEVFGELYGTSLKYIESLLDAGFDVLLVLDTQGYAQVKANLKEKAVGIFLLPKSLDVLKERMVKRGQNLPEDMENRLAQAKQDISKAPTYDYTVINDNLKMAVNEVQRIIKAVRAFSKLSI